MADKKSPYDKLDAKRAKWNAFYSDIAKRYAEWSKSPRTKVGCIIVSGDYGKILAVGYNGWEIGGPDTPDSVEPGMDGAIHAEINCAIKLDQKPSQLAKMFITHNPCRICARVIVNLGCISHVYYSTEYRDTSGLNILKKAGIYCEKIA